MVSSTSKRSSGAQSRTASRTAARLISNSSETSKSSSLLKTNGHKRRRIASQDAKEERLAEISAEISLAVNELFQLKEYTSIAYWNPADFSHTSNAVTPQLYDDFVKNPEYQLKWPSNITPPDLDSIPLRQQKRAMAEYEQKLYEKFPFKEKVEKRAEEIEIEYLNLIEDQARDKKPIVETKQKPKKKQIKREKSVSASASPAMSPFTSDLDELSMPSDTEYDTHYQINKVKCTIPPPLITHPSHIPKWRPVVSQNELSDQKEHTIESYSPEPIQVISTAEDKYIAPLVEEKLRTFMHSKFKAAIIDENTTPDYNNTPEEFAATLHEQQQLMAKLRHKIYDEKRLELNGDKIEPRKTVLKQSTTKSIDPFRSHGVVAPKVQGLEHNATYLDYLVSQGMAYSRLQQHVRKLRQNRARRVAQLIEQHFKKKSGEKERLQREQEQNLKKMSRIAIQAVKKRWTQAHKVYRYLQEEKEEELKKIQGRQHLSEMLEHSTQLLEAQLNRTLESANEQPSGDSDSSSHSSDMDHRMSSSSDSEGVLGDEDQLDMDLTVEQLREKYAKIELSMSPSVDDLAQVDSDDEDDEDDDKQFNTSQGLAALYGGEVKQDDVKQELEYTQEQKDLIEKMKIESVDPALESDETSDSDSISDLSDLDTDASESSEVNGNANGSKPGLAALFGNTEDASEDGSVAESDVASDSDVEMSDEEENGQASKETKDEQQEKLKEIKKDEGAVEEVNGSKVRDVPVPSLLRGNLRPYQKQGLNWLASLYNNNTNGILADEMGLGKTIQTIALLAYLACEHHIWGPHLIVVPTSVMLNWEMEFKKFAPGFKVLTYYGTPQERARKRKGWNKPDTFHVCITSYQLVVHDHLSFKRRRWRYMILDEAHNIKNFRSTRWKALLNFNTENRLLLTGTPLQNNLIELWSLLYFLMPSSKVDQAMPDGFANLEDFQTWFGKPVDKIMEQTAPASGGDIMDENITLKMDSETRNTVARLHQVLRPYLLRRLKKDVEKQMPGKYEHIVYCRLSNRQRYLYDDFMSRAKTKETLASGNFLSIINCLMQLRKVCNHPDLFEVRPIVTSFAQPKSVMTLCLTEEESVRRSLKDDSFKGKVSLDVLNLNITRMDDLDLVASQTANTLRSRSIIDEQIKKIEQLIESAEQYKRANLDNYLEYYKYIKVSEQMEVLERLKQAQYLNELRCSRHPLYGRNLLAKLRGITNYKSLKSDAYNDIVLNVDRRSEEMGEIIDKYSVITPKVVAVDMKEQMIPVSTRTYVQLAALEGTVDNPFHQSQVKLSIAFPDKSLLQFDCGKLQKLAQLLQKLTSEGHRALIFTQMTKVLDILEQFLNIHGYRYMRLDGATKIEERQVLTETFNRDPKIPVFILSTRSGGLGINLTGADTVIFYDSDWNPAMDKQCQDRCHRIGQSRDVHIYRFVSEYTIESNILKKANQKRHLDNVVIQEGEFTTDYFGKFSVRDLVADTSIAVDVPDKPIDQGNGNMEKLLAQAEDEADRVAANAAMREVAIDDEDFDEEKNNGSTNGPVRDKLSSTMNDIGTGQNTRKSEDEDFNEGVGHIDEYMLRFIADGYYD